MPVNKNALIRYHALDRCFSNPSRNYCLQDLLEECRKVLFEHTGNHEGVGRRQFFNDILFMESEAGWAIPLERCRDGKKVYYRYADSKFSINNQPLNAAEADQIKSALFVMSRFKGLPQFEWMDELIPVIENKLGLVGKGSNVILFDNNEDYTGLQYITPIFHAVVNQQVLKITYHDFKSETPYDITFHPYIIKQYNNRWFSFGLNEERPTQIWNIALDRIVEIKNSDSKYISNETDWENDYFYDFVGVTKNEEELVEIKIELNPEQVPYIRTKPIHGSQKGPTLTNDGWIISIRVIPNYELMKMLLSFGDSIRIISPDSFRLKMISVLKSALEKYEKNQG